MTIEQVAEALQVSKDTVYDLLRDGELDRTNVRRSVRVPKNSVLRYIAANTKTARPTPAPAA